MTALGKVVWKCFQPNQLFHRFVLPPKKQSLWFLISTRIASDLCVGIFIFILIFCYETMSNCSQNCWINWNPAVLCFKWLFHTGVWTFARFCEVSLSHQDGRKKKHVTAPNLKPTDKQKLETFFGGLIDTYTCRTANRCIAVVIP